MTLAEEKEWVKKAKKDPEAFGRLYDEYYPKIMGYVLRRTASVEDSQEIVCETFLKALKNIWRFRWRNVPFGSWLYRIAANEIVNFFRRKKPVVSLESVNDPFAETDILKEVISAQEKLKEHQDFLNIQEEILSLPPLYQEVLALRFFEGKAVKEVADILGKPEGTVKSLLRRGLEKLKEKFSATP
jgi:RNA polymerase sigma-70 factor (ECF subfamily)